MDFQCGLATVTSKGLLFNHIFYTSPQMIKGQWFQHAAQHGDWVIPILFDAFHADYIVLLEFNQLVVAPASSNAADIDPDVIKAYQDAFRNLKLRALTMRKH